jgi:hypothetical protein
MSFVRKTHDSAPLCLPPFPFHSPLLFFFREHPFSFKLSLWTPCFSCHNLFLRARFSTPARLTHTQRRVVSFFFRGTTLVASTGRALHGRIVSIAVASYRESSSFRPLGFYGRPRPLELSSICSQTDLIFIGFEGLYMNHRQHCWRIIP